MTMRTAFSMGRVLRTGVAAAALLAAAGPALAGPDGKNAAREPRFSAVGSYLAGRIAQSAGDWDVAARHLAAALKADPENTALMRRTFLLQLGEGDTAAALTLARQLEEMDATSFLSSTLLAADAMAGGRIQDAQARLDAMPADGLGKFVTPLLAAWTAVAAGDAPAARAALAPLNETPGFRPLQRLQAALIEDLTGDPAVAGQLYAQAAEDGAPLRLVQLYGNFLERRGDAEAARKLYEGYRAEHPESPSVDEALARIEAGRTPKRIVTDAREGLAEALFDLASALHQESALEMALLYGRVSLMLNADQPLARLMIGDVLSARGRHEDALAEYRAATGPSGVTWVGRLREADTLRRLEREAEAQRLLEGMAAERADRADALLRLGDIQRNAERYDAAVTTYGRAIERLQAQGRADWVAFYVRGLALDAKGEWTAAEADLRRALELSPEHPQILNYLGYSLVDRGSKLDEAIDLIARAVDQRPNDGYIIDSLGWAKFKLGDYYGAIDQLEKAVELQPTDPTINDHLGDAYWAVGRKQEARFQWRRAAQQADADADLRATAEEKLKNGLTLPKTAARDAD